jgi:hypothetical protein
VGRKAVLSATGAFNYSAFYQFAPFAAAGATGIPAPNYLAPGSLPSAQGYGLAPAVQPNTLIDGVLTMTSNFSKHSSISVDLDGSRFHFLNDSSHDFDMWGGHAIFHHQLSRAFGWHLGYGRERVGYAFGASTPLMYDTLDAGVDYADSLSFARRTTLSFATSTSALHFTNRTYYQLNGHARLTRDIGRTWSTSLGFNRQTEFVAGFDQPLLSNFVNAEIGGLLAPRLAWSSEIGLSRGSIGFVQSRDFTAYTGSSRLESGITRTLAVFGQYTYYQYEVPPGSGAGFLVPRFSRHAVTIGLTAWIPIIKGGRPS